MQQLIKIAKSTISSYPPLLRRISTATKAAQPDTVKKEILFQQLYEMGAKGGSVSEVIHRNIRMGKRVTKPILIHCLQDLRRLGRYHYCLQILDWLDKGRYGYSSRDHALHLKILCKLKGLDQAEKHFDTIPADAKDFNVYEALLDCYCKGSALDKALSVFKKMDEMGYASHVLADNNILSIYLNLGQPEKMPPLVSQMKNRNVKPNGHTYSFWIQSYRLVRDLEGVERVFNEAVNQASLRYDLVLYGNVAASYMELGQTDKAIPQLQKLEDLLDNSDRAHRVEYQSDYLVCMRW